jgi:hypothetical protein
MSEHESGNNPIAPGTKIKSAWMEWVETMLATSRLGTFTPEVYVSCYIADSTQEFANKTGVIIDFTNNENTGDGWDSESNTFTAPSAGYYYVSFQIQFTGLDQADIRNTMVYIYKNTSDPVYYVGTQWNIVDTTEYPNMADNVVLNVCVGSTVLHLAESDYIRLMGMQANTSEDTAHLVYSTIPSFPHLVIYKLASEPSE